MSNRRINIAFRLVLSGLALLATLLLAAPAAFASEGCPNEAVRAESNVNPTTGQPYSQSLPECRAYEMVTPLDKQDHNALTNSAPFIFVSPSGNGIEWTSQGAYAGAENYEVHGFAPSNPYLAQRTPTGWVTRSTYPPSTLTGRLAAAYDGSGVFSPSLEYESVCGSPNAASPSLICALRDPNGAWSATPEYASITGSTASETTEGASRDGEVYVFKELAGSHLLRTDTSVSELTRSCLGAAVCGGIYEVTGIGSSSPELKLVDVNDAGEMIGPETGASVGAPQGSHYQAVSATGAKIFFTATPEDGVPTLYVRVNGTETVAISNPSPSECTICSATSAEARFQGASASGDKVFFTTSQQLLNGDTDSRSDLYEYDFNQPAGHELVQVSSGGLGDVTPGAGADVLGVAAVSEDGSHVYFIAEGVLTTLPNGLGQTANSGADNLYAYSTETDETRFVATLTQSDKQLWGESVPSSSGTFDAHTVQATPDGQYLAFDSFAPLISSGVEASTSGAQQVYRYNFDTGKLVRISLGHEGYANNGNVPGFDAVIAPTDTRAVGSAPTANESNRAISENGGTIAFVTAARLQGTDVAGGTTSTCAEGRDDPEGAGCEIYVWHECAGGMCPDGDSGDVSMVSDGESAAGVVYAGMSATASDIFFQSYAQLVGQDTDRLGDIYDAKVDGGLPAPMPEPSCAGEACQGAPFSAPVFAAPGTVSFSGGANDVAPAFKEAPSTEADPKSKPLTNPQKLAKALKACKKDRSREKRARCERSAIKRYGNKKKKR